MKKIIFMLSFVLSLGAMANTSSAIFDVSTDDVSVSMDMDFHVDTVASVSVDLDIPVMYSSTDDVKIASLVSPAMPGTPTTIATSTNAPPYSMVDHFRCNMKLNDFKDTLYEPPSMSSIRQRTCNWRN